MYTAHENKNLGIIRELDLSRAGQLQTVYGFRDFTNLNRLILRENKLNFIRNDWFEPYNNIQYLDASRNEITVIQREDLRQLAELTHLNLANNEISNIQSKSFVDLPKLEALTLRFNELQILNNMGLQKSLKLLDLSDNALTTVIKIQLKFINIPFFLSTYCHSHV